jgi:hypothetical protein
VNHLFTGPLGQPLTDPPSLRYFDSYSSYRLLPNPATTQSFGVNPSLFGFLEGHGNSSFSTNIVVDIVGASYLLETSLTQVTPNQSLANTSPFSHGSGNIPDSLFPHMHTPISLLGRPIGQMVENQVIHTTTVIQATEISYHTSHIITHYIRGQSSMGGQPSTGGSLQLHGKFILEGNLHGCNIKKPGGKPLLLVIISLLPLACILDNHFHEFLTLCGVNTIRRAFLRKELFPVNPETP